MLSINHVATNDEARELANYLRDPRRTRPVVVVTSAAGESTPWIDVNEILDQVGDLADVYQMPTSEVSREFARLMPEGTEIYGGFGRVYPLGNDFLIGKQKLELRMAFNTHEGSRCAQKLISDALSYSVASHQESSTTILQTKSVTGLVKNLIAGRAVVKLDDGSLASITAELTLENFQAEQLFRAKQEVNGQLDIHSHRLDVSAAIVHPSEALSVYELSDLVLTRVQQVAEDSVSLELYPKTKARAVIVSVPRDLVTGNPLDDLRDLFAIDDVVRARLIGTEPNWALVLTEIDDDEVEVDAPSLLPGGPPWLLMPEMPMPTPVELGDGSDQINEGHTSDLEKSEAVEEIRETVQSQGRKLTRQLLLQIDSQNAETTNLREQIESLASLIDQAEQSRDVLRFQLQTETTRANRLQTELDRSRSQLRKAKTSTPAIQARPNFGDPEVGFRFAVLTQWAIRLGPGEQKARPLRDFGIGHNFITSMKSIQGIDETKVADVVFEIVTGLADSLEGRETHVLRNGLGASEAPVSRGDGAVCWRASLQVGTPSARRIHYWKLPNGDIELSRVVVHDDFKP